MGLPTPRRREQDHNSSETRSEPVASAAEVFETAAVQERWASLIPSHALLLAVASVPRSGVRRALQNSYGHADEETSASPDPLPPSPSLRSTSRVTRK